MHFCIHQGKEAEESHMLLVQAKTLWIFWKPNKPMALNKGSSKYDVIIGFIFSWNYAGSKSKGEQSMEGISWCYVNESVRVWRTFM
jgi:hypothetical protein